MNTARSITYRENRNCFLQLVKTTGSSVLVRFRFPVLF